MFIADIEDNLDIQGFEMLSAVALINQAIEAGHLQQFSSSLINPSAGLSNVDAALLDRCDSHLSDCVSCGLLCSFKAKITFSDKTVT